MVATPSAFWFLGGSPQQVQADVGDAVARGGRQGRVPVLVAYNHPFRDCTGYGLIGATDTPAYQAWIDGLAAAIGNEKAIVILEPNSLGLVPYGVALDGTEDKCKPTRADADGRRIAPPGATPDERYAQLAYAVDALAAKAPNAAVYLDGTHSNWLATGDAAYRLARAGVDRAAGFFLNAGNYQPTARLVQYGTWVSKCLYIARRSSAAPTTPAAYRACAATPSWTDPEDETAWAKVDAWYAEHVDRGPQPPQGAAALTHFVINTNRNGRGPLVAQVYGRAPFDQPPAVVEALRYGSWCMPPGRGLGIRPTTDTGLPLVDAFLWTDTPGLSVASCDIAGGARAWDYGKYNPWGLQGDAQNHFDPLWGRVLPPAGDWFPDEALQLARNANPPLDGGAPVAAAGDVPVAAPARVRTAAAGRPVGHKRTSGQPASPAAPPPPVSATEKGPLPRPQFDAQNPYR
jgi:endoglucanase